MTKRVLVGIGILRKDELWLSQQKQFDCPPKEHRTDYTSIPFGTLKKRFYIKLLFPVSILTSHIETLWNK